MDSTSGSSTPNTEIPVANNSKKAFTEAPEGVFEHKGIEFGYISITFGNPEIYPPAIIPVLKHETFKQLEKRLGVNRKLALMKPLAQIKQGDYQKIRDATGAKQVEVYGFSKDDPMDAGYHAVTISLKNEKEKEKKKSKKKD